MLTRKSNWIVKAFGIIFTIFFVSFLLFNIWEQTLHYHTEMGVELAKLREEVNDLKLAIYRNRGGSQEGDYNPEQPKQHVVDGKVVTVDVDMPKRGERNTKRGDGNRRGVIAPQDAHEHQPHQMHQETKGAEPTGLGENKLIPGSNITEAEMSKSN